MPLYLSTLQWDNYTYYIVRTNKGLAFVSTSQNELHAWQKRNFPNNAIEHDHSVEYKEQIGRYLQGELTKFSVPVDLYGTKFQKLVWKALLTIPYGKIVTYSEIAEKIGKPKAIRAVANAIGKNPVLLVVPCHRVIRKDGDISGFRAGVSLKKKLLKLEQAI